MKPVVKKCNKKIKASRNNLVPQEECDVQAVPTAIFMTAGEP